MTTAQIDQVRTASDLVAIAGEYAKLTKKGPEWWCKCLFHQEKSASLHFHPERRVYRCFGCNASGDVFAFVMAMEGLSFPQAVRALADRAGIDLEHEPRLTMDEKVEQARRRQQADAIAADCAAWMEDWLNTVAANESDIRRMNRSFNAWAMAEIARDGTLSERGWFWADVLYVLTYRPADGVARILDADPQLVMEIYRKHRAAHPLTAEIVRARIESKEHALAIATAVVDMLAASQESSAAAVTAR